MNILLVDPVLLFNTEYLNSLGRGATFKEISKSIVENIKIPVPPIELQNQFANFVEQVDKSKVAVQKALDEAQTLFNSLMQEYFGWGEKFWLKKEQNMKNWLKNCIKNF